MVSRRLSIFQSEPDGLYPSCKIFTQAIDEGKQLLLFVQGYNNDMKDVLKTANELEEHYDVIVVPFSWPANGGGKVSGAAAYLSDKDDARSSATALHRAVQKVQFYHQLLTENVKEKCLLDALEKHPDNRELALALFTRLMEQKCRRLSCEARG